MRRKIVINVALWASALLIFTIAARAQRATPDQQLNQARSVMFQSEARYFDLASRMLQEKLNALAAQDAATARWWAEWWKGAYPDPAAPAMPAAPLESTPK